MLLAEHAGAERPSLPRHIWLWIAKSLAVGYSADAVFAS
jgi:hypothetical protein